MDALEKMNEDIRAIAEQVENGHIFFPQSRTPVIVAEVEAGKVIEVEVKINGSTAKYMSD